MSSYPLPALRIQPPQQPNLLEQAGQTVQLSSLLGRNQLQQQQIQANARKMQEGEAFRQTFSSIASKMPDATQSDLIDATVKELSKNPIVSPDLLQTLQLHSQDLRLRTKAADEATLKLEQTQMNNLRGAFKPIHDMAADAPPETINSLYKQQLATVRQDPQKYGQVPPGFPEEFPGKDKGDFLMKSLIGYSNQVAEEKEQREAAKETAQTGLLKAQTAAERYKLVNGTLYDVSGATPKPALSQGMNPQDWQNVVDSVAPPKTNAMLNARTKSQVNFYLGQGNLEAAQKALTAAASEVGGIEKETSPAVISARVGQAVATEVGKAKVLAPTLEQVVKTTMSGRQYVDMSETPGMEGQYIAQQARAKGIPVLGKEDASTLAEIDTAKANQQYMLDTIGKKLASDASGRLYVGPKNTIEKLAQTDPELAAVGTFRNAAIQSMGAVAGSKGLRINRYEVQMAIDNDIPKPTDTLPAAQQKLKNLQAFLDNSERAHLVQNRQAGAATPQAGGKGGVQVTDPRGGIHTFPDQQSADAFKKAAGIQ